MARVATSLRNGTPLLLLPPLLLPLLLLLLLLKARVIVEAATAAAAAAGGGGERLAKELEGVEEGAWRLHETWRGVLRLVEVVGSRG